MSGGLEISSVAMTSGGGVSGPSPTSLSAAQALYSLPTASSKSEGIITQNSGTEEKKEERKRTLEEAANELHMAQMAMKRRRCLVAVDEVPGFVRTVYTLLKVCDADIISWSPDGNQVVIKAQDRFASEVCPKFFRHRNFNSFTRLLNMYQFHKVPASRRESKEVCFEHPNFKRGREDLLPMVQRKGAQILRDELLARELYEKNIFVQQHQQLFAAAAAQHAAAIAAQSLPRQQSMNDHTENSQGAISESSAVSSSSDHEKSESLQTALQPMHPINGLDGHAWMARMTVLENELNSLKQENQRLKSVEDEHAALKQQLQNQSDLIASLQAQANFLDNCAIAGQASDVSSAASSSAEIDDEDSAAAAAAKLSDKAPMHTNPISKNDMQDFITSIGGPVNAMAAMMFALTAGNTQNPAEACCAAVAS